MERREAPCVGLRWEHGSVLLSWGSFEASSQPASRLFFLSPQVFLESFLLAGNRKFKFKKVGDFSEERNVCTLRKQVNFNHMNRFISFMKASTGGERKPNKRRSSPLSDEEKRAWTLTRTLKKHRPFSCAACVNYDQAHSICLFIYRSVHSKCL